MAQPLPRLDLVVPEGHTCHATRGLLECCFLQGTHTCISLSSVLLEHKTSLSPPKYHRFELGKCWALC